MEQLQAELIFKLKNEVLHEIRKMAISRKDLISGNSFSIAWEGGEKAGKIKGLMRAIDIIREFDHEKNAQQSGLANMAACRNGLHSNMLRR